MFDGRSIHVRCAAIVPIAVLVAAWAAGCGGTTPETPPADAGTETPVAVRRRVQPPRLAPEPDQPARSNPLHGARPDELYVALDPQRSDVGNYVVVREGSRPADKDLFLVESLGDSRFGASLFVQTAPGPQAPRPLDASWVPPFPLPAGCSVVAEAGATDDGWPRRLRWRDGSESILVPGGPFIFGHDAADGSQLAVTVEVSPFYMDRTEVTVRQYELFRQAQREARQPLPAAPYNAGASADHPAVGIPIRWALAYAHWLGKDLPTECEWEKAARGPYGLPSPWGAGRPLWTAPRTPATITAVAAFHDDRSPYGIFDLAGNAREWCRDWFAPDAHRQIIQRGPQARNWSGPRTPDSRLRRVVKGNARDWRSWHREGVPQDAVQPTLGFRCVWRPPNSPR